MRIVNGYLFRAVAGSTALVLLVLVSIGAFMQFVSQLDDLGQGDYDMWAAMQYVLLKMPRLAHGMLPVSVLLGSLLGLGALASGSELIILQAAGVSVRRIAGSVLLTGVAIAVVGGAIGEFIAPELDLYARQARAMQKSGQADITGSSAWLREGDKIFNVRPSIDAVENAGVYVFRMQGEGELAGIGRADSFESADDVWVFRNYRESVLESSGVSIGTEIDAAQVNKLNDLLSITAVNDSSLTAPELYDYIGYLKSNGLDSERYEIVFWSRVATVAGIAVMCVLAVPFVFGSLRDTGAGARMIVGVLIGVGYFLLSNTLADSGAVFDLSPVLVAWMPTALLAGGTFIALNRMS
ncbi:MAG: LPS export ABC transporter permease LptG [Gammaproteobacteria bacterium]|nr:LPS export ABC transporter permease LptG [Gammaproteobacteria bacterium]